MALVSVAEKEKYNGSCKKAFRTGKKFYQSIIIPQQFSLPYTIMTYLWKAPSNPDGYQKLIQTCKFFFAKNSILVFPSSFEYEGYSAGKPWMYCPKKHCQCCKDFCCYFKQYIYLEKMNCKVWPLSDLYIIYSIFPKNLMPKLYRSDVKVIILRSDINYFKDVLLLAASATHLSLGNCVLDDKDQQMFVEDFINNFPTLEGFSTRCNNDNLPYKNFKKLLTTLKMRNSFTNLSLTSLPDNYNIEAALDYIKELKIQFRTSFFYHNASLPEIANHLEKIVDEIIETETKDFDYCPPFISFWILKQHKFHKYRDMDSKIDDYCSRKLS